MRSFLRLPIIMPFPSGMTAAGASEFSLQALMSNANAYAEEYVSVTTASTSTALTAAQFLAKNIILASGASGNFTLTLPATSKIIDALGPTMPRNGAFYFPLYVANNTAYVATLTAGDSSTTFAGSAQIASNVTGKWMVHVVAPTNAQGVFTLVVQRIQSSGSGSVGIGTVTQVSVVTANGVSGSVATDTTTPAITLTLGAITPTTVNGLTISPTTGTLAVTNAKTLTVSDSATLGTNSITFAGGEVLTLTATNALTLTTTGATNVTLPTSGTLMANPMTTGGDIIYGGASGLPTRLANGTAGFALVSNGTTLAPSWQAVTTAPAGSDTQIQYNNSNAFGADSGLTYTSSTKTLNLVGSANTLSLAGAAASANVTLAATGTDADVGIELRPKGDDPVVIKKAEGVYLQYINASSTVLAHLKILGAATEASIGLGLNALAACGTNAGCIAIGVSAGLSNTSGSANIGIGKLALTSVVTASNNTAIGYQSLRSTTAASNTGVGAFALEFLTSGGSNTAVGSAAGNGIGAGARNTALGFGAMFFGGSGDDNVAIGASAMGSAITSAAGNVAIGKSALINITTGADNTAIGFQSCAALTTGSNNVAIGTNSFATNTTGSDNIAIGSSANVGSAALSKAIALGANAVVSASNCAAIGGTGADALNVGINMTTPTARLHLPAGTTAAGTAPLKLTSGTNMTSVENGAFEYDGTNLYFSTGGTRKTVTLV